MHSGFAEDDKQFYHQLNENPSGHVCFNCGKPATHAVVYGGKPGIIRWYCDKCEPPEYIRVRNESVPIPEDAPIHFLFYLLIIIAHGLAFLFGVNALGRVFPFLALAVPKKQREYLFGDLSEVSFLVIVVYITVFTNLVVWFFS